MTSHDAQSIVQQMMDGYRTEKVLYQQLLELAGQQLEALTQGQAEQAAEIAKEKGRRIEKVQALREKLDPVRGRLPEIENEISAEDRQALQQLGEELRELIGFILEKDEESELLARQWSEKIAGKIHQAHQSKTAARAYEDQKRPEGKSTGSLFVDRKE